MSLLKICGGLSNTSSLRAEEALTENFHPPPVQSSRCMCGCQGTRVRRRHARPGEQALPAALGLSTASRAIACVRTLVQNRIMGLEYFALSAATIVLLTCNPVGEGTPAASTIL